MKEPKEKRPSDLPGQKLFTGGAWDNIWKAIKGAKVPDRGRRPEPPSKNASESSS